MAWREELEARARTVLAPAVWNHVQAGAGDSVSAAEAVEAWRSVRFAPHVLRDVSSVDTSATLLGTRVRTPVAVAPTSMQRAVHPEGERAVARGAEQAGALHVVSSNAGHRFADLGVSAPWWLQVYLPPERGDLLPVVEAAASAGAQALVLTVDTPVPGPKPHLAGDDWHGIDLGWFRCNFADPGSPRWADDLTVTDIGRLREASGLPVVVKGVLRADDARRCVQAGADAVWVSNHGGRQLDRALSTRSALPAIAEAVTGQVQVYVDGGVRSGLDVLAGLALGADAVFVGRPVLHALAVDGASGVRRLLEDLTAELVDAMRLAGCARTVDTRSLTAS